MSENNDNITNSQADSYDDTPRVNLDLSIHDKNLSPQKVAALFIEISQRAEKCFDFEISKWLEIYERFRLHPNFSEAALVISSASQIYARKIDYLENLVLRMCSKEDTKHVNGEQDQTKIVRRGRGKKYRPNTINDNYAEVEFIVKEITTLPKSKLTEIVQKKKKNFDSHWEKFKASQCKFLKNKKNKLVVSKKMTAENSEIIALNSTFGKTHIYDYENEEIVGTKSDFRCFSNIINENAELLPDYNFNEHFSLVDSVDRDEEKRQRLAALGIPVPDPPRDLGPKKFQVFMPAEYMKSRYNIEITGGENKFKRNALNMVQPETSILLEAINDFSDMPEARETAKLPSPPTKESQILTDSQSTADSGVQSMTSHLETISEEAEEFFDAVADFDESAIDISASLKASHQTISNRLSIDEGISVSCSIQSPCQLSEIDSSPPFIPAPSLGFPFDPEKLFDITNLFQIDEIYLHHMEDFDVPSEYFARYVQLESNFLQLPEGKLRRKCLFSLPVDDFVLKQKYIKSVDEPKNPRIFKPPIMPEIVASDSSDFEGFSETEVSLSFVQNVKEVPQSTPQKPSEIESLKRPADEEIQNNVKRISFDSEIMTDDESGEKEEPPKNTSTPERIKHSPRMSRDSGIKSPSPPPADEILTVTIEENPIQDSCSASVASFQTAEGHAMPDFSFHDRELILAAQNKHQEQVSEMQQLVEKVNRWHQYLKPILKDSQERGHFEIHEYGTKVLDTFEGRPIGDSVSFADVMHGKSGESLARFFLSTLMLCNTGNVQMTVTNSNPQDLHVTDPTEINLKLLSRERVHEHLMDDTVPCISNGSGNKRKASKVQLASQSKKFKC